jgi:hypothetical protein
MEKDEMVWRRHLVQVTGPPRYTNVWSEHAIRGQATDRAAQGGQDADKKWGLIESYHEENIHRDEPQSEGLDPVHDTFYGIILGQSSTPVGRIGLEVSCGLGDNTRKEVLTFEVASFDIGYNCILGRPFLLKFMAVIHTGYATLKMPGPKGVITLMADQRDALACENTTESASRPLVDFGVLNDNLIKGLISCVKYMSRF